MDRILHSISTLWIYARREKYIDALAAEDAELALREQKENNPAALREIRHRRAVIEDEMAGLSAPLSWRSLVVAPESDASAEAVAVLPTDPLADEGFTQAA